MPEPNVFTEEQIIEITGLEKVESPEDLKTFIEKLKTEQKQVEVPAPLKDDFIKGAVDHYNKSGDLSPYLKNNIDYTKKEAGEVLAVQIGRENEGISEKALNALVSKELAKYKAPEGATEDEVALQQELLDLRVNKITKTLTEEQKKFTAPETQTFDVEKWAESVNGAETTKGLVTDKKLNFTHGEGEDQTEFHMEVDSPESLVEMTIDNTGFFKLFTNEKGETDFDKWYKVMSYAKNPQAFEALLIKHGQSNGTESVVKGIKNQQLGGRTISSADKGGLLQAFADKGVASK